MSPEQNQPLVGNGWQSPFPYAYSLNPQPYQGQYSTLKPLSSIPGNTVNNPGETFSPPPYEQPKIAVNHVQVQNYPHVHHQPPASRIIPSNTPTKALDTKKMEDDLRRILKLDVNQGLSSSGIQSSYA
jgi:hypothetical protein